MNTDIYGIEDLLDNGCNRVTTATLTGGYTLDGTILYTNTNNTMKNTKELNFIEKIKLEKFANSKEAEQLSDLTTEAEKEITTIGQVIDRLNRLSNTVADSIYFVNEAVERQDINGIQTISAELTEQLKLIRASNFATPINELTDIFGIETVGVNKVDSKTVAKSLGFKVKEKN